MSSPRPWAPTHCQRNSRVLVHNDGTSERLLALRAAVKPWQRKAPPNRARLDFWRRAIEPDSPGVLTSGPPARAVRAVRSPRQPAVKERTRCPPLARRWHRIRSAASAWRAARRAVADPAAAHAEWLPHGQSLSIRD